MNDKRPWNEGGSDKPYTVSVWYDTPVDSDSCATGYDFASEKEARLCLADMDAHFGKMHVDVPYVLLDGPGVHEVTVRTSVLAKAKREREEDDRVAKREFATQCGMEMGIQAYNDAMGYDSEPYDPSIHDNEDFYCEED